MAYTTNPFIEWRWDETADGGRLRLYAYDERTRTFEFDGVGIVELLAYTAEPRSESAITAYVMEEHDVTRETATGLIERLLDRGLLIDPAELDPAKEAWLEHDWRRAFYYFSSAQPGNITYTDHEEGPDERRAVEADVLETYADERNPEPIYPDYEGDRTALPEPRSLPEASLYEVLADRRTCRSFDGTPITAETLSTLLAHAFRQVRRVRDTAVANQEQTIHVHRFSMELILEVYPILARVDGVESGVYQYDIRDHALIDGARLTTAGADETVSELVNQSGPEGGAVTLCFAARIESEQWRYRHDRAFQNLLKKLTTHAHRAIVVGETLGLSAFISNGVSIPAASELVGTDPFTEPVVYLVTLGSPADTDSS